MKKTIILLAALIAAPAVAATIESDAYISTNTAHAKAAADLVVALGYRCDTISNLRPAFTGGGHILHCNKLRYAYHIRDRGGRWVVTVE